MDLAKIRVKTKSSLRDLPKANRGNPKYVNLNYVNRNDSKANSVFCFYCFAFGLSIRIFYLDSCDLDGCGDSLINPADCFGDSIESPRNDESGA